MTSNLLSTLNPKAPEFFPAATHKFINLRQPLIYYYATPPITYQINPFPLYNSRVKEHSKPTKPLTCRFFNRKYFRPPRLLNRKVPVNKNQLKAAKKSHLFLNGKTSLMIRNIPNNFGRSDLLAILDKHCRKVNGEDEENQSSYDFLYLPMDFVKRANLGYAFVNFTSSIAAERFKNDFDNFLWNRQKSKKICQISLANYQGKDELSEHFKKSKFTCHTTTYLPVILTPPSDGVRRYELTTLGYRVGLRGGGGGSSRGGGGFSRGGT